MTDGRRTIIVTGASRGLGAFIKQSATEAGYNVIGLARSPQSRPDDGVLQCDIGDPDQVRDMFKSLKADKTVYGLVNAAGVASMNLVLATPDDTFERIVRTNLLGTMYCNAAMGRILARRQSGRIINFSTIAVPLSLEGEAAYVASKAGVEGFSRSFAREMSDFNVTVNVVAPGPIATDLIKSVPTPNIDKIVGQQIIRRMGRPEDVWKVVAFLLSDQADMISGQVMGIGGAL